VWVGCASFSVDKMGECEMKVRVGWIVLIGQVETTGQGRKGRGSSRLYMGGKRRHPSSVCKWGDVATVETRDTKDSKNKGSIFGRVWSV